MAFVAMAPAVTGQVASSSEYNKVISNVVDLDARMNAVVGNQAYCHVYQSSTGTQVITNLTAAAINFDGEVVDPLNWHSNVTNNSRITPTVAGRYRCTGGVCFPAAGTGSFLAQFRKNGALILGSSTYQDKLLYSSSFTALSAMTNATLLMNGTTDYIQLWTNQNTGGNLTTFSNSTDQHSYMLVEYLGAT